MKSAKLALVAALFMTLLSSARCLLQLFFSARFLNDESNPRFKTTGMAEALRENLIHHKLIVFSGEAAALAWNLVVAGLLIFAMRRVQKVK